MAEESANRDRALEAIENTDPELSEALERLADGEEQALQQARRERGRVTAPPDFLAKVMDEVRRDTLWRKVIRKLSSRPDRKPSSRTERAPWYRDFGIIVSVVGGAAATAVIFGLIIPPGMWHPPTIEAPAHLKIPAATIETLARLKSIEKDYEQAGKLYLQAADEIEKQPNLAANIRAVAAGSLTARAASAAWLAGSPREAKELFLRAEKQTEARGKKVEHLASAAQAAFSEGNYEESKQLYLYAAEQTATVPDQVPHLIGAAQAAFFKGNYEESKQLYLRAAGTPLAQAANAALRACDYEEAITILEGHSKGERRTAEMHFILGSAYHSRGELDKAIEYYQHVTDSAQKDQDPQFVESAWFNLGVVYATRFKEWPEGEKREEARRDAREALKESINAAADSAKDKRRHTIKTATLRPSKNACGQEYYSTEDLTPLEKDPEVKMLVGDKPIGQV